MKRLCCGETLEPRRVLTFTFTHELVDLPLDGDVGNVMEVIDLNQDSHIDLVIGSTSGKVHTLLGQADGSFEAAEVVQTSRVRDVFVADLNGDERQDLVLYSPNRIWRLTNRGNLDDTWLGFDISSVGSLVNAWDAQIGFLNGDEHVDLVVGDQEQIKIYLGNGDGTFEERRLVPTPELFIGRPELFLGVTEPVNFTRRRLDVGDLNNDGFDDIVTAFSGATTFTLEGSLSNGPIVTYINDRTGSFVEAVLSETEAHLSLSLFDIDRDNDLDLLVGGPGGDYFESVISLGNGDGTFELSERWSSDPSIIGEYRIENSVGERAHSMTRRFGEPEPGGLFLELGDTRITIDLPAWRTGTIPHFVDLDQDGVDEIVGLVGTQLAVVKREPPSPLISPNQITLPAGNERVLGFRAPRFLDDFDRDGYVDHAWLANRGDSLVLDVRWGSPEGMTPGTPNSRYEFPLDEWQDFFEYWETTDTNSDGFPDFRFVPFGGPELHVLSSGDRTFRLEHVEPHGPRPATTELTAVGDIDGDGFEDRVTLVDSLLDGLFSVQRGHPNGTFEELGITYQFPKPAWDYYNGYSFEFVNLVDITGDGILDVVYFDDTNTSFSVFPGISNLTPGDVNRDGEATIDDLELLSSHIGQNELPDADGLKLDWTGDQRADERDVRHLVEHVFQAKPGDLNLDGLVDFADFLVLSNHFGSNGTWVEGDFDGNSQIDFADFLILSTNFQQAAAR